MNSMIFSTAKTFKNLQETWSDFSTSLRPLFSIIFIVGSLLGVVSLRTYERQLGYEVLALHREHRLANEEKKRRSIEKAKLSRPQHVESLAQRKFDLKKVKDSQIIVIPERGRL